MSLGQKHQASQVLVDAEDKLRMAAKRNPDAVRFRLYCRPMDRCGLGAQSRTLNCRACGASRRGSEWLANGLSQCGETVMPHGALPTGNRLHHGQARHVDHRDVVAVAVGHEQQLLVRREGELPDPLPDQQIFLDLERLWRRSPPRDWRVRARRRPCVPSLVMRTPTGWMCSGCTPGICKADGLDDLARLGVDHRDRAGHFRGDPELRCRRQ